MPQKTKATAKSKSVAKKAPQAVKEAKGKAVKAKGSKSVAQKVSTPALSSNPKASAASKGPRSKSPPPAAAMVPSSEEIAVAKEALKSAVKVEKAPRSRKTSVAASASEATGALAQKWSALFRKAEQIEAKPYNMTAVYEEKTAIMHKVLGWGYILTNRNDRLEVLFKDGIKYLISNYKP